MNDYWNEHAGDMERCGALITDLWENDHPASDDNGTLYEEQMFAERVYKWLDQAAENQDVPFFLFYSAHIAHSPVQVPEDYLQQFDDDEGICQAYHYNGQANPVYPGFNVSNDNWHCRSIYQSMVSYLDEVIGNITDKLKANGQWENTLIVFTSDNGG